MGVYEVDTHATGFFVFRSCESSKLLQFACGEPLEHSGCTAEWCSLS